MDTRGTLSVLKKSLKNQWVMFISIFSALVLVLGLMTGVTMFTNEVLIIDGDNTKTVLTASNELDQIMEDNSYILGEHDKVFTEEVDGEITAIHIMRAFPVKITADGKDNAIWLTDGTVNDALESAQIYVNEEDLLNIGLTEPVKSDMHIVVKRVTYETDIEYTDIPFGITQVNNPNYKKGIQHTESEGSDGLNLQKSKKTYIDGVLTLTDIISNEVVKEPVNAVVSIGTCPKDPISKAAPLNLQLDEKGIPANYKSVLTGKATAYSAKSGAWTASGRKAVVGTVAVNPNIIPYGSRLYITSTDGRVVYGYAIAADTGIALMDGRVLVDVFTATYKDSCKWGAKQVKVYIL